MRSTKILLLALAVAIAIPIGASSPSEAAGDAQLTVQQLVELAVEANPLVRAARARWLAAVHSIKQNYAPSDPVFTYTNSDSPKNPFGRASLQEYNITEPFQFPGKALLQTDQAKKTADIARLTYDATIRDIRAATETAYYQLVLDIALGSVNAENVANLERVLKVTQVAYSANQVTQTDFISAEFDLAAARQLRMQYRTAVANDETLLNQLLNRSPGEPIAVDRRLDLERVSARLDTLVSRAIEIRQEILEAALNERNSQTAIDLARMEYLPDLTLGFQFDNYLIASFAPKPSQTQDYSVAIGLNLPIFFWLKQKEDVERAQYNLEAARYDLGSIRTQTAAAVTALYRSMQFSYETALLYRDSLIGLAHQDFEVALIAYQSGKIDFTTLSAALRRGYDARVNYLQSANQFLAGEVALEQTLGGPIPK
ncbi:MAG TPA: TolC family protein [Candidatus Binataceae bacterium]